MNVSFILIILIIIDAVGIKKIEGNCKYNIHCVFRREDLIGFISESSRALDNLVSTLMLTKGNVDNALSELATTRRKVDTAVDELILALTLVKRVDSWAKNACQAILQTAPDSTSTVPSFGDLSEEEELAGDPSAPPM